MDNLPEINDSSIEKAILELDYEIKAYRILIKRIRDYWIKVKKSKEKKDLIGQFYTYHLARILIRDEAPLLRVDKDLFYYIMKQNKND